MSDPVKNVEDVEDVLSSIRRLVSETSAQTSAEAKAATPEDAGEEAQNEGQNEGQDEVQKAPANDALILTSALRVKDPAASDPAPMISSELESLRKAVSGAFDDTDAAEEQAQAAPDERRLNLFPLSQEGQGEADTSNIAKWPVAASEDYYEDEAEDTAAAPDSAADWDDTARHSDETDAADPENFVFDAGHSEADGSETDDAEDQQTQDHDTAEEPWIEVANYEEKPEDTADGETENQADHEAESADHEEPVMATFMRSVGEGASSHEGEADHGDDGHDDHTDDAQHEGAHQDHDHNDDGHNDDGHNDHDHDDNAHNDHDHNDDGHNDGGHDDNSHHAGHNNDDAHHDDAPNETVFAADDSEGENDDPSIDLGALDEAVIDEDMLRDLVAEIVRQELTGAMGERITRNVRKLVRREIHRAMSTREFD